MEFKEITIPMPWGKIAGKWWGLDNRQPVIALHGWLDNAGTFDTLAPLLVEQDLSLLCIDLPGHGFSSHYPKGMYYYVFWDGMLVLKRIINHFKWKKVQILGHSLGGAIAFLYAGYFPKEVECYIGLDNASAAVRDISQILGDAGNMVSLYLKYDEIPQDDQTLYDYDEMVETALKGHYGSCTRTSVEILLKRGMQPDGKGDYYFTRDPRLKVCFLGAMDIQESLEIARRIRCRVMNIRAEPGRTWNVRYYNMVLDEIEKKASCMIKHVVDGTHHVHLNHPERVAGIIVDFLKSKSTNK